MSALDEVGRQGGVPGCSSYEPRSESATSRGGGAHYWHRRSSFGLLGAIGRIIWKEVSSCARKRSRTRSPKPRSAVLDPEPRRGQDGRNRDPGLRRCRGHPHSPSRRGRSDRGRPWRSGRSAQSEFSTARKPRSSWMRLVCLTRRRRETDSKFRSLEGSHLGDRRRAQQV
jgi:hypothetical protein